MKSIVFTSTLPPDLMKWLKKFAKSKKLTKASVIAKALQNYKHEVKRREYEKSFKALKEDPEILEMAEWGLKDYNDQLKRLDV